MAARRAATAGRAGPSGRAHAVDRWICGRIGRARRSRRGRAPGAGRAQGRGAGRGCGHAGDRRGGGRAAAAGGRPGLAGAAVRRESAPRARRGRCPTSSGRRWRGCMRTGGVDGRAAFPSSTRRGGRRCVTARSSPSGAGWRGRGSGSSPTPSGRWWPGAASPRSAAPSPGCRAPSSTATPTAATCSAAATPRSSSTGATPASPPSPRPARVARRAACPRGAACHLPAWRGVPPARVARRATRPRAARRLPAWRGVPPGRVACRRRPAAGASPARRLVRFAEGACASQGPGVLRGAGPVCEVGPGAPVAPGAPAARLPGGPGGPGDPVASVAPPPVRVVTAAHAGPRPRASPAWASRPLRRRRLRFAGPRGSARWRPGLRSRPGRPVGGGLMATVARRVGRAGAQGVRAGTGARWGARGGRPVVPGAPATAPGGSRRCVRWWPAPRRRAGPCSPGGRGRAAARAARSPPSWRAARPAPRRARRGRGCARGRR